MLIGTAGHIDHGKTSLVKALTGIDADRLPEEKARGITIDLGYAHSQELGLAFVDVPGHEKLIHNMLAGATGIDFVLLVVAADDGPMPQTREHLNIIDLLGVQRGVVALSKADKVDAARLAEVEAQTRALLRDTALHGATVIGTSARTGEGIDRLKSVLVSKAAGTPAQAEEGEFRLAIDRCFSVAGAGTVVTGTVHAGTVSEGADVVLTPPGLALRVRALQVHNRTATTAGPGQRCALNLVGEGFARETVQRGHWIVAPSLHRPTQRFDAQLRLLPAEAQALAHWAPVHLHLAAAHVTARVALLEDDHLRPGESALAQVVLDRPIGALHGDRFIIRDPSAQRTLGGGVVIDPFAVARFRRGAARISRLRALASGPPAQVLSTLVAQSPAGVSATAFRQMRNVPEAAFQQLLAGVNFVRVVDAGSDQVLFSDSAWSTMGDAVRSALSQAHEREPDMQGVSRERLRRLLSTPLTPVCFDALLAQMLETQTVRQTGAWLHLPAHEARLAPAEQVLWMRIAPLLGALPWQPPRVRDVARELGEAEASVRGTLKRVARTGGVFPVAHDHYFLAAAVVDLANSVIRLSEGCGNGREAGNTLAHKEHDDHASAEARTGRGVSAAEFRDIIGTGRKLAIQILEFFDRVGFTRRVKDRHLIRNRSLFADVTGQSQHGRESSPGGAAGLQIR